MPDTTDFALPSTLTGVEGASSGAAAGGGTSDTSGLQSQIDNLQDAIRKEEDKDKKAGMRDKLVGLQRQMRDTKRSNAEAKRRESAQKREAKEQLRDVGYGARAEGTGQIEALRFRQDEIREKRSIEKEFAQESHEEKIEAIRKQIKNKTVKSDAGNEQIDRLNDAFEARQRALDAGTEAQIRLLEAQAELAEGDARAAAATGTEKAMILSQARAKAGRARQRAALEARKALRYGTAADEAEKGTDAPKAPPDNAITRAMAELRALGVTGLTMGEVTAYANGGSRGAGRAGMAGSNNGALVVGPDNTTQPRGDVPPSVRAHLRLEQRRIGNGRLELFMAPFVIDTGEALREQGASF
jgi:hypothetical protein